MSASDHKLSADMHVQSAPCSKLLRVAKAAARQQGMASLLFDQQQPPLPVTVEGVYGSEQARTLDQPWLKICVDVKNEYEVLRFEIATDR
jgi:hypothetical protein